MYSQIFIYVCTHLNIYIKTYFDQICGLPLIPAVILHSPRHVPPPIRRLSVHNAGPSAGARRLTIVSWAYVCPSPNENRYNCSIK